MRISDWSSDVCSSDLTELQRPFQALLQIAADLERVSLRLPFHHGLAVGIENTDARAALADIQTHAVCCFVPDRRAVRSGAGCCALPAIVAHCAARIAISRPAPVVGLANRPDPDPANPADGHSGLSAQNPTGGLSGRRGAYTGY